MSLLVVVPETAAAAAVPPYSYSYLRESACSSQDARERIDGRYQQEDDIAGTSRYLRLSYNIEDSRKSSSQAACDLIFRSCYVACSFYCSLQNVTALRVQVIVRNELATRHLPVCHKDTIAVAKTSDS